MNATAVQLITCWCDFRTKKWGEAQKQPILIS